VIYALVSDIHSNLEALRAVKADFPDSVARVLCLGDMVGYGPDPNLVLELLQGLPLEAVAGNHDRAVSEPALREWFNPAAAQAIAWTEKVLASEHRAWLRAQPSRRTDARRLLVHGSPNPPYDTEYILEEDQARAILTALPERLCLFGHTHLPRIFTVSGEFIPARTALGQWRALEELPALINPGSVGQPRDGNPDASYALFDSQALRVQFRRVPYDTAPTRQKILEAGLPTWFAKRLTLGI
jgi:predicted phosphodiesterase